MSGRLQISASLFNGMLGPVLLMSTQAFGAERFEFFKGARQMGMGGAYTATVNDETAVLTNPAGLGKIRNLQLTILDPEVHTNSDTGTFIDSSSVKSSLEVQGLLDILNKNKGKHYHARGQVFPSIVGPNFGFGVYGKYEYNAEVDSAATNYRYDYTNDMTAAMGYCLRFLDGILKVGFAGRLVDRVEVHKDLNPNSTNLLLKDLASEGVGAAADGGIILTAPVAYLPAIAATWRDIGHTSYTVREGMSYSTTHRPDVTPQTVDVGLSIQPIFANIVRMQITAEYRAVTTPLVADSEDVIMRTHGGAEINVGDFLFLRGGANQGYWTSGLEFATPLIQFQVASYGEEIGTPTARREDRRWIGKIALRF